VAEIEDTSCTMAEDPHAYARILSGDGGRFVREMEAEGQRQLVASTLIPAELIGGTEEDLRALGIEPGEPDPADPLFRTATLPQGWSRQTSDHTMWSYIVDQHGRRRAAVFYKAAFYDRRAHLRIHQVASYAGDLVYGEGTPLVLDDWATAERLVPELQEIRALLLRALPYTQDQDREDRRRLSTCDRLLAELAGGA